MQILETWTKLTQKQKAAVIGAAVMVFAAILLMSRLASAPSMSLLYSGLSPAAAGEVVGALDQRRVAYQVRNDSIYVDASQRDTLRLTLAADGLPANGIKGYELLDGLSGFGTTSRMFDAAYWRAIEGELARTIASSPQISSARVHIANVGNDPFRRSEKPSASVTVHTANGGLAAGHARALTFLVASAIAGLSPENVTIMDENGDLLGVSAGAEATGAAKSHSDDMRARILRLLEARVGPGNAVVEVAVETVTEREFITERLIDPQSRVAISTDSEEIASENSGSGAAAVTVASNLPDGDAAQGGGDQRSQESELRERVNYEVSETHREVTRLPGAVRRLSVAILVNHVPAAASDGALVPRSAEELADLQALVASAVGLDTARGDSLTIRSMAFEPLPELGSSGLASLDRSSLDWMSLLKIGILAAVTLILGLFVLRPALTARALPAPEPQTPALSGVIEPTPQDRPALPQTSLPDKDTAKASPVDRLRDLIGERQDESLEILRSWLEEKEERV